MGFAPEIAGPHDPVLATPPRAAGSIRRTSTIGTTRPDGVNAPIARVDARARDLLTGARDETSAVAESSVRLEVDQPGHLVVTIDQPDDPHHELAGLVGAHIGAGWRRRVVEVLGRTRHPDSLLFLLLDDLPGATLVSGVATQNAATVAGRDIADGHRPEMREFVLAQADICAGWDRGGAMFTAFGVDGQIPTPLGPRAPRLDDPADPLAWHELPHMRPHDTRRSRRLDLGPNRGDGTCSFDAHFRDSHMDGDGLLRVVHEYTLLGTIDVAHGTATEIAATANVLPWIECPAALASANRVLGLPLSGLREHVPAEFRGVSTCTHLNDMLRCLADVPTLLDARQHHSRVDVS